MLNDLKLSNNNHGNYIHAQTDLIREFLEECSRPESQVILDLGSGDGHHLKELCYDNKKIIAVDIDKKAMSELANEIERVNGSISCIVGDIRGGEWDFRAGVLDIVLLSHVLHYFRGEEIDLVFKKLYEWIRPGGKVFIQSLTVQSGPITYLPKSQLEHLQRKMITNCYNYKRGMPDPGECNGLFEEVLPTVGHLKNLLFKTSLKERALYSGFKLDEKNIYYAPLFEDLETPQTSELVADQPFSVQLQQARVAMIIEKPLL